LSRKAISKKALSNGFSWNRAFHPAKPMILCHGSWLAPGLRADYLQAFSSHYRRFNSLILNYLH
jgi:hypothetical protein